MSKEKTFTRPIIITETIPVFVEGQDPTYETVKVPKVITFKDLDESDREQHDLHFLIMAHFTGGNVKTKGRKKVIMDPDFMKEVTTLFIEDMTILTPEFTLTDKEMALSSSAVLIGLATWLLPEKITPFFLELTTNLGL